MRRWISSISGAVRVHPRKRRDIRSGAGANARKSSVRARAEHVFAHQKSRFGLFIRTIGPARRGKADACQPRLQLRPPDLPRAPFRHGVSPSEKAKPAPDRADPAKRRYRNVPRAGNTSNQGVLAGVQQAAAVPLVRILSLCPQNRQQLEHPSRPPMNGPIADQVATRKMGPEHRQDVTGMGAPVALDQPTRMPWLQTPRRSGVSPTRRTRITSPRSPGASRPRSDRPAAFAGFSVTQATARGISPRSPASRKAASSRADGT